MKITRTTGDIFSPHTVSHTLHWTDECFAVPVEGEEYFALYLNGSRFGESYQFFAVDDETFEAVALFNGFLNAQSYAEYLWANR